MRGKVTSWFKSVAPPLARIGLLALVAAFATAPVSADQQAALKPAYRLGVFPYLPALTIDRLYGPVAEAFSLELDRLVKLRTRSTFEHFADAIAEESYDIIFVHPFLYVEAVDQYGYLPLARLEQPLNAVLVAAAEGGATGLEDLVGEVIGLPPKLAAVSHLIKAALIDAGLRPGLDVGIRHFRNKASCLQAAMAGGVAACGVPSFVFSQVESFGRHALKTIFAAPPVRHFAFAAHSRMPEEERARLKALILSWNDRESGEMVATLGLEQGFAPIDDGDYDSVRLQRSQLQTLAQR
jgi:ABC-type phosphate/phosphonate transport system substrate-binding protein